MGPPEGSLSPGFPSLSEENPAGWFLEGSSEPTSVASKRLEDEVQVSNSAQDLPRRLQLLHNLKCDQEEDEEAEGDPEPTWWVPVDCAQLPAREQTFETIHEEKKPSPVLCVGQAGKEPRGPFIFSLYLR